MASQIQLLSARNEVAISLDTEGYSHKGRPTWHVLWLSHATMTQGIQFLQLPGNLMRGKFHSTSFHQHGPDQTSMFKVCVVTGV